MVMNIDINMSIGMNVDVLVHINVPVDIDILVRIDISVNVGSRCISGIIPVHFDIFISKGCSGWQKTCAKKNNNQGNSANYGCKIVVHDGPLYQLLIAVALTGTISILIASLGGVK